MKDESPHASSPSRRQRSELAVHASLGCLSSSMPSTGPRSRWRRRSPGSDKVISSMDPGSGKKSDSTVATILLLNPIGRDSWVASTDSPCSPATGCPSVNTGASSVVSSAAGGPEADPLPQSAEHETAAPPEEAPSESHPASSASTEEESASDEGDTTPPRLSHRLINRRIERARRCLDGRTDLKREHKLAPSSLGRPLVPWGPTLEEGEEVDSLGSVAP